MANLSSTAFRSVPDPSLLYLTDQHARALAFLRLTIAKAGCMTTLVGDEGCGKTLLVSSAINDADDDLIVVQVDGRGLDEDQLLREALTRLRPVEAGGSGLLPGLTTVRSALAAGRGIVLFIINNAQALSPEVFQCLQAMSRPEKGRRRRVSLILTGHPGLETLLYTIGRNVLEDWNMLMAQLPPLSLDDVSGYVRHRVRIGGDENPDSVFDPESHAVIHRLSGGIPQRINELCDKALELVGQSTARQVGAGQLRAAARELGWPGAETDGVLALTDATAKPTLTLSYEGEVIAIYPLEQERTLIGREADNEVPVDSPYISRHHALIVRDEQGFWITDINSTNGTFLNGERVSGQVRLGPGDHVRIGRHEMLISMPGEKSPGLRGMARLNDVMSDTLTDPFNQEAPKQRLNALEAALSEDPDNIELQFERACLLSELDRKDEAISVFDQILRQRPGTPEVHNNLAVLLAERGDLLRARAELEKAVRLAPEYACAQENLADIYLQLATTTLEAAHEVASDKTSSQRKLIGLARLLRD